MICFVLCQYELYLLLIDNIDILVVIDLVSFDHFDEARQKTTHRSAHNVWANDAALSGAIKLMMHCEEGHVR